MGTTDSEFLKAFDQRVAKRGLEATLDALRRNWLRRHAERAGGRLKIDDTKRLDRMARHLANDADLRERRLAHQSDRGVVTEAARRAINDLPHEGDIVAGDVHPKALRRLRAKFKDFPPFFAWDDTAEHGYDRGELLP